MHSLNVAIEQAQIDRGKGIRGEGSPTVPEPESERRQAAADAKAKEPVVFAYVCASKPVLYEQFHIALFGSV